jgi:predicted TPR repeat methyltransferase
MYISYMPEQPKQKPPEKPQENAGSGNFTKSAADSFWGYIIGARDYLREAYKKLQNIEKANIELGIYHLRAGNFVDAATRFRIATLVNKNNSISWYLLGKTYVYARKRNKAIKPLKNSIRLNPELDEARFLLSACGSRQNLGAVPRSFVIEKLDIMASNYEVYLNNIGNTIAQTFGDMLYSYLGERTAINTLDINCRGGELGALVKSRTNNMIGVEPSIKLAGLARTKRDNNLLVFNFVQSKFPEDYLKDATDRFDLAICALYLDNIGSLDGIFAQIANVLNPNGAFIFNINKIAGPDYEFMEGSLIFGHSDAYIRKTLEKTGFKIVSTKEIKYASNSTDIVYLAEKK